ncbi:MAG: cold-shock protein [Candidatus Bathyarchaeia archaeon]
MTKGVVKRWLAVRGYGFIRPEGETEDVFVHNSDLNNVTYLREGEKVEFEVTNAFNGPRATNVKAI